MVSAISLNDKIDEISNRPWFPVEVARLNSQVIRLALFKGEYHWHQHSKEEELIFVHRGSIIIQFKDRPDVTLKTGELAVIPKGVEHCPKSLEDSYVLMVEPASLKSRGD